MARSTEYDATVVGSGPNGLAAAVTLAEAGCSVLVVEAADTPGGGMRTKELTLPGFHHDVCSAIHPLGAVSPAFAGMGLDDHGLEWVVGDVEVANPLDDGSCAVLLRDLAATDAANDAGGRWSKAFGPLVEDWPAIAEHLLGPPAGMVRGPVPLTKFGLRAGLPASMLSKALKGEKAAALFAGIAAHANTSLSRPLSSTGGTILAVTGHLAGWPLAKGGSQAIADALVARLDALGGKVECGWRVRSIDELPPSRALLFDTSPWQLLAIAGERLPYRVRRRWQRFRHGSASFKIDYALDGPVPWTAEEARRSPTVHLGGTLAEIAASERAVFSGVAPEKPFVLVAQQSVMDPTRAPDGKQTLWAYCHVPFGSTVDMTERIEAQIDRFAPGWRDLVLARHVTDVQALEAYNPNYVGGDIACGAPDGLQILFRPDVSLDPYKAADGIWLCSSATPPGGGVHGLPGWWAARSALRHMG